MLNVSYKQNYASVSIEIQNLEAVSVPCKKEFSVNEFTLHKIGTSLTFIGTHFVK